MRIFGPPTNGIWWSLIVSKIWFEFIQYSFDNKQVLIFCELGFKTPIYERQNGGLRDLTLTEELSHREPQKALPCAVMSLYTTAGLA